jgi:hypothetical protein
MSPAKARVRRASPTRLQNQQHPAEPSAIGHAGELALHEILVVQNGGEILSGLVGLAQRELTLGIIRKRRSGAHVACYGLPQPHGRAPRQSG